VSMLLMSHRIASGATKFGEVQERSNQVEGGAK
jgi:hypothetical protein